MNGGVIFDLDGVIIDSEPFWAEALKKTFREIGVELTDSQAKLTRGRNYKEVVNFWCKQKKLDISETDTISQKLLLNLLGMIDNRHILMDGAIEVIKMLREKGMKVGIATSSPAALIEKVITKYNLDKYIDSFTHGEEVSHSKPNPEIYLRQSEKMGIPPGNIIAVEDSVTGMVSAYSAGCIVIAMPSKEEKLRREFGLAHYIIYSLRDIKYELIEILFEQFILH